MKTEATDLITEVEELLAKAAPELLRRLVEEVKTHRAREERRSTCAVCTATLLESNEPPHCIDCYVTEEDRERWEDQA